jgi:hypothetical protein
MVRHGAPLTIIMAPIGAIFVYTSLNSVNVNELPYLSLAFLIIDIISSKSLLRLKTTQPA